MSEQDPGRRYRAPRLWPGGRRPEWPSPGREPGPRPEFDHPRPVESHWVADEPPSLTHQSGRSSRLGVVALVTLVLVVFPVVIGGLAVLARGGTEDRSGSDPAAEREAGAGAPTGPTYSPLPPATAPLLALSWQDTDETYLMDLGESGIAFRTPDYWGCARMASSVSRAEEREGYVRWVCGDDGGTFPTKPRHDPGSIMRLELLPCENGACSVATRADAEADGGPLGSRVDTRLDERTWTWSGAANDDGLLPRGLLRTVDLDDDGAYEAVLSVAIFASPPDEEAAGKVLRDLYDHAF